MRFTASWPPASYKGANAWASDALVALFNDNLSAWYSEEICCEKLYHTFVSLPPNVTSATLPAIKSNHNTSFANFSLANLSRSLFDGNQVALYKESAYF